MTKPLPPLTRAETPYSWHVSCGMPAYAVLAGVRYDRLFTDADAIVEAYRKGRPLAEALFGPDVGMGGPYWAGNSYGHINALGSQLVFPEDSEVAHTPLYDSLAEGTRALKREVDFTKQGLFPRYLALWEELKRRFPGSPIPFGGFKAEGPVTTAWLLRGHEFFADLLEQPEEAKDYLNAVTESVVRYNKTMHRINGEPERPADWCGLADDAAAMIGPRHWPEFVMPFLDRYYAEQTDGRRSAHIEDLRPEHLPFLDALGLSRFDPSVSARLTPALVAAGCRVPFYWRINSMQFTDWTAGAVAQEVARAREAGASTLFATIDRTLCTPAIAAKVRAFIGAARQGLTPNKG